MVIDELNIVFGDGAASRIFWKANPIFDSFLCVVVVVRLRYLLCFAHTQLLKGPMRRRIHDSFVFGAFAQRVILRSLTLLRFAARTL